MKTHVVTLSKRYLKGHPKAGQPTDFKQKFLSGEKIHTLRENPAYWLNIVNQVNSGEAVLSVREWSEKAYNSPQVEIKQLTKLGFQLFDCIDGLVKVHGKTFAPENLPLIAKNDGLEYRDFLSWFEYPKTKQAAIIHFTDLLY
jgi:hypothetical protein